MSLSEVKPLGTVAALIKERRTIREFKQDLFRTPCCLSY